jgi:hypothetical protein
MSVEQEPDLEKAMTPDQVQAARLAYAAEHGHAAFQTQPTTTPTTAGESRPTTAPTTSEPYIEPESEREVQGQELEALREQARHIQSEN